MESNRILGKAMENKDEMERIGRTLKKGKKNVARIKMKWAAILEEFKRFSTQIAGIHDSLHLAFQENPAGGSVESFTRLLNLASLMGQIVAITPLLRGAADKFTNCIEPDGDFETIDAYVEVSNHHNQLLNKCLDNIRKLRDFENVRVTTVDEALFVKKYTKCEVEISDYLPRERIDEIQAAIDAHNAMSVDDSS